MAGDIDRQYLQELIISELAVRSSFYPEVEIELRIQFLVDRLEQAGASGIVVGISGGVDSSVAGRLCQLAVERIRASGGQGAFIAMRLPYGSQHDEDDATSALEFVRPDAVLTVDIQQACDAMLGSVRRGGLAFTEPAQEEMVLGNIKARQRMVAQYAVAGARNMLVAGTDHAAEAAMGFFTKHGDGACDVTPLAGLTKRRVRALAGELGAPERLIRKTPSADLHTSRPGLPDEDVFGISYDDIDDFLEGKDVRPEVHDTIVAWHRSTAHKRALPIPAVR